jgi:hypothetical protein
MRSDGCPAHARDGAQWLRGRLRTAAQTAAGGWHVACTDLSGMTAQRRIESAEERHARRVERVAGELAAQPRDRPVTIHKKAVSHLVPKRYDARRQHDRIDISDLDEILDIDPVAKMCTAEPGVTFRDLVRATLPHGLVPIVVPELSTITVGGAVSGCSLESMSFKYGGFHDTCLEYEVVTSRGDILHCTPENEHALVFQMMHGAFGTLGVLSKLKFRLIAAKPYVRVSYHPHSALPDYLHSIYRQYAEPRADFMDGIIHAPNNLVLSLGEFVDEAPYTNRYDWTKVYYESTAARAEDFLRTPDYFFRYDRGVTNVHPKSRLGRLLLGKMVKSAQVLRLAEKLPWLLPAERPDVTVDLFLPFSRMTEFMRWYEREIGHFPLWCVPYRRPHRYEWIADDFFAGIDDELFIDLAIYGMKQPPGRNIYQEIEDELMRVQGIKTLISYNEYDEDTFWRIFNRGNHLAVKAITDPDGIFGDFYTRTCKR